jgi:hypothetical protein
MKKHKVKTFQWFGGELQSFDFFFESEENAMSFGESFEAEHIKIFNPENEVVATFRPDPLNIETYAESYADGTTYA